MSGSKAAVRRAETLEGALEKVAELERCAVIDIGSNSIRLVVYDGLWRVAIPIFNEKVTCGLGRGLRETGRLSEEGVALALPNLVRFTRMTDGMGVERLELIATAAVRDSENGAWFLEEVERHCGHPVTLLSGKEEARISALGVIAGVRDADGIMGDLGGGSLELVEVKNGKVGKGVTLGLGPLPLSDLATDNPQEAHAEIDRQLDTVDWLKKMPGRRFYAVGGAWRALARIHMSQVDYPLHVIHNYRMVRHDAENLLWILGQLGQRSLARIPDVARRRLETVPLAALVLQRVIDVLQPEDVVWSSFGLREGFLYDQLSEQERLRDPLIEAARDLAAREGRFGDIGPALTTWTDALFPDEKEGWRTLREAACHLSDFAWRDHPDYRAAQAFSRILHYPFSGVDHPGRAYLAYAIYTRYGGDADDEAVAPVLTLFGAKARRRARILGLGLRLAYTLSAGTRQLLTKTEVRLEKDALLLTLPDDGSVLTGEAVERRFDALVEAASAKRGMISVGGAEAGHG